MTQSTEAFWVIAGLLLLFELSPVIVGSGYDSQGVATSDAFTFAILYLYGPWPAIALLAAATLVSELIKKKPPWRMFWNIGQFGLSLGSAALLMVVWKISTGEPVPALDAKLSGLLQPIDLVWIVEVHGHHAQRVADEIDHEVVFAEL